MKLNSINKRTDVELYEMLKGNKKDARLAFEEIYSRYSQKVYTFCVKLLNNETIAEDIFQECFTRLFTSSQKNSDIGNISGYLFIMARNLCFNELNRKRETEEITDEFESYYSDNTLENKELGKMLQLAFESLPDHLREVIILRENLDMSYAEIAEALNISLSAVRVNIFRAKDRLRKFLTPYLNDVDDNDEENNKIKRLK